MVVNKKIRIAVYKTCLSISKGSDVLPRFPHKLLSYKLLSYFTITGSKIHSPTKCTSTNEMRKDILSKSWKTCAFSMRYSFMNDINISA